MIHRKIHPSKISLVSFSRIFDGTVATLNKMKSDTEAWLAPQRVEDGITINFTGELVDYEEQDSRGILVLKNSFRKRHGVQFSVNLGRWSFQIEALHRGLKPGDVDPAQTASILAAADATAMTGLAFATSVETEKFGALIEMPPNKDDSKVLYLLLPKVGISIADREQVLNHNQQTPTLTFKAYALETSGPDELTPVQSIYLQATDGGLIFPIEGKTDLA